jgi:hypothetical protein
MPLDVPVTLSAVPGSTPLGAHRPEPTDPPNPGEPDTVPDPTREPGEPSAPPIGDPPLQPNQAPHVSSEARRYPLL